MRHSVPLSFFGVELPGKTPQGVDIVTDEPEGTAVGSWGPSSRRVQSELWLLLEVMKRVKIRSMLVVVSCDKTESWTHPIRLEKAQSGTDRQSLVHIV